MPNNDTKQIVGAIIIAGAMIAGAIIVRGGSKTPKTPSIAKQIDLNTRSFNKCLAEGRFKDKVQADIDDGAKAGVEGTPASFIVKDGKVVEIIPGAQPIEKVRELLATSKTKTEALPDTEIRPIGPDDHIIGDINAELVVVEYSDLECPFCQRFHNTMKEVVAENNGTVAWVYRHYPIPQLHPKAFQAAEASECAWEQGGNEAFWKYADKVFEAGLQTNTF